MIENGQLMGGIVEIGMNKIEGPGCRRGSCLTNLFIPIRETRTGDVGTITATASTYISRANWNIMHQPKATWNFFDRMKGNLINNDIPIRMELIFTNK